VALILGNELYIANAGDSRAVFSKNKKCYNVTEDHKPSLEREVNRICSIEGGFVLKNRVQGKLAVTRSLGDFQWNPYVSEVPDVYGPFLWSGSDYEFLILACDGLWDVIEEQSACDFVQKCKNPRDAAVQLRDFAYDVGRSRDNISVVVIFFPGFTPEIESEETSETGSGSGTPSGSEESEDSGYGSESEEEQGTTPKNLQIPISSVTPSLSSTPQVKNRQSRRVPKWKLVQIEREEKARVHQEREKLARLQKIQGIAIRAKDSGNPSMGITALTSSSLSSPRKHT